MVGYSEAPTGPLHELFIGRVKISHYRRVRIEGGGYFLTVALFHRQSHLLTDSYRIFTTSFSKGHEKTSFYVMLW